MSGRVVCLLLVLQQPGFGRNLSDADLKRLVVRETVGNHFSEVIVDALNRYYVQNHSATLIMRLAMGSHHTYSLQSDIMDEVMQRTSRRIAYEFRSTTVRNRRPRIFNIAFIDGYAAFRQLFYALDPTYNDFSGYYLIVLTMFGRLLPSTLQRIFAFLWTLNVVNVNIVTADLQDHSHWQSVLMYTYYPYRSDSCERIEPVLLHRFRKGQRVDRTIELFPGKLDNLHRCRVTVCTFHLPPYMLLDQGDTYGGFEGDMLAALSEKLNFTVQLVRPEAGEMWGRTPATESQESNNSGTMSGCVRMVLTGRANFTFGRFAIRGDRNRMMKHGRSYYTVHMVFAVPSGREYTPFEKLFRPFARSTWTLVVLYLAAALVVIYVIHLSRRRHVREFVYGRGVHTPILNLVVVLFGGALQRLPARNFARTLLFLWMYYSLVVRTSYQSSLFEYLQEHKNFSPLQTIDALVKANYRFYSLLGSALYLQQLPDILERITWLSDTDESIENLLQALASQRAPATAVFTDIERIAFHNRFQAARTGPVHMAGSSVLVRFPIGIYYPKKSCLVNQIDRELDYLLTSGYVTYRLRHYVNYHLFRHRPLQYSSNLPTPLKNDHLIGCYETLVALLLVATALLLLELVSCWFEPLHALFTFLQTE